MRDEVVFEIIVAAPLFDPQYTAGQGGFASAVFSHEGDFLTLIDGHIDIFESPSAVFILKRIVVQANYL